MAAIDIATVWDRIRRVLARHAPDTARTLAPPATDAAIAEVEAAVGRSLPADLRASLCIHNGQADPTGGCHAFSIDGLLLGTADIADRWRMLTELDAEHGFSQTDGHDPWWKGTCVPFTDADGNMLCVDTDPALGDRTGEVVCHVHDSAIERGIATSYSGWLAAVADQLDAGQFSLDEHGYVCLDLGDPPYVTVTPAL